MIKLNAWSLVKKLMFLYTFSVLGILASLCLFLYPTFMDVINHVTESYITALCYKKVILGLLLTATGTIILGYMIARNGLSRITAFSDEMENITASSLNKRIDPNDWPKEIKIVANKFNIMLSRIETSFMQVSQFSSDIAHELRNPINNLLGNTETALLKDKTNEEYRIILERNYEELQSVSKLLETLFFLAHADHGQLTLNKKELNAKQEVMHVCDYYSALAEEKDIQLVCIGDAHIFADPTLIKRVFSNLISNALRYTEATGRIDINIAEDANAVKISVIDSGIGVANEHVKRIFDRFYRVDSARSYASGGLGLGLAIVKSIIDLHKGWVDVSSQLGKGTAIHIYLPHST